jgi:hypothetical protein
MQSGESQQTFRRNNSPTSSVSQAKHQHEAGSKQVFACCLLHVGHLFALLFDTEDGGDVFLRMSVDFHRATLRYNSADKTLHSIPRLSFAC